jgi:hypothetical protein
LFHPLFISWKFKGEEHGVCKQLTISPTWIFMHYQRISQPLGVYFLNEYLIYISL